MTIRPVRDGDQKALYDVCLRTGDSGEDATGTYRDPDLLGSVYVGPYLALQPEFALVAHDDLGVGGYALGAADTSAFEAACEKAWWPALRDEYPTDAFPPGSPDGQLVATIHEPPRTPEKLLESYPAHVHIDLLPRFQGRGYGRRMLGGVFDLLARGGAPGVHLGVSPRNKRAIGFYEHFGMTVFAERPDLVIMTLSLSVLT